MTPWTVALRAPPSTGFSRQEYWSGLLCSPPGRLPDPGIEPGLLHCRWTLSSKPPENCVCAPTDYFCMLFPNKSSPVTYLLVLLLKHFQWLAVTSQIHSMPLSSPECPPCPTPSVFLPYLPLLSSVHFTF